MRDVIRVQDLGKQFRQYDISRPTTFQEAVVTGFGRLRATERFWALRNISFTVPHGHMLGVIGANGAGKSTLLRLIGGVGRPDEGTVEIQGRVGGLLELGAGFHPDLTGRENVFINGVIFGLTRREVIQRFEEIVTFAELEDTIDNPLRTYSTGMRMRLGFAIAAHSEPEVLLIDEVLAVGDVAFRQKCFERIDQFRREGRTIVFVSHNTDQISDLCDKAIWLRAGRLVAWGDPTDVVSNYVTEMDVETHQHVPAPKSDPTLIETQAHINGNGPEAAELRIVAVRLLNQEGIPVSEIDSGDSLRVELEYSAPQPVDSVIFSSSIHTEDHQLCCRINTAASDLKLPSLQGRGRIMLYLERLELVGGEYYVSVGAYDRTWTLTYDYLWNVHRLLIRPIRGSKNGVLLPPHHWEIGETHKTLEIL